MSVDLTRTLEIAALIGGETLTLPLDTTDSTPAGTKLDNVITVPANYAAATTLWQAANHGTVNAVQEFTNLIIAVDPKKIRTDVPYINLEIAATKVADGSVTVFAARLGRNGLLHLDSAVAGGSVANQITAAATMIQWITRIRATNPHATLGADVRTIVLA